MKRSKKYKAAAEKIKEDNLYMPGEAMKLVKETSTVKYDATVDIALFLGVDPKKADQAIPPQSTCHMELVRLLAY